MKINAELKNLFFTSDYHLYHKNILEISNRPFDTVMDMNNEIRDRHNELCDRDSETYNLGDALLIPNKLRKETIMYEKKVIEFLETFNGTIYYIPGNHEADLQSCIMKAKNWWPLSPIEEITVEKDNNQHIVMCHYAMRTWNKAHHGSIHLYGHSHGGLVNDNHELMSDYKYSLSMDVGVDQNNYYPFSYFCIMEKMRSKTFRAIDHHCHK